MWYLGDVVKNGVGFIVSAKVCAFTNVLRLILNVGHYVQIQTMHDKTRIPFIIDYVWIFYEKNQNTRKRPHSKYHDGEKNGRTHKT